MERRGIVLFSGGLDSILTARLLLDQGIELLGICFVLPFHSPGYDVEESKIAKYASDMGLKVRFIQCGMEYINIVKNPLHGHGKNMNPCIDCKIHFIKEGLRIMKEEGYSFLATGEVVGQRPMSQMKAMLQHISNSAGDKDRIVRPLCAKLLAPTIPEIEGIIDRDRLLDISGRGRQRQMELARQFGIKEYATPAGGCLLTEPNYCRKLHDLFDHKSDFSLGDIEMLSVARHLRIRDTLKILVARNLADSNALDSMKDKGDAFFYPDFTGTSILALGDVTKDDYPLIASILLRYSPKANDGSERVVKVYVKGETEDIKVSKAMSESEVESMII